MAGPQAPGGGAALTERFVAGRKIPIAVNLRNDSYLILIGTKNATERYYRDEKGWVKVSTRGRKFRATAEQVLNHLLPALAGLKPNLSVKVEHRESTDSGSEK